VVALRFSPFEEEGPAATSWGDVARAWAIVVLFVAATLIGRALDLLATIEP